MNLLSGMIAYPGTPRDIGVAINQALTHCRIDSPHIKLTSWEENDIPGRFLVEPILDKIDEGDVLVADITSLNFNVVFEIGYAIACGKRVLLIKNRALFDSSAQIREVGLFDTLGYKEYSNSKELATYLAGVEDIAPLPVDDKVNTSSPVYIVLPKTKTDTEIHTVSRVKKAGLRFRNFDPEEQGRLSAADALEGVAKSHGVVTFVLGDNRVDAAVHNMRAAFVAGLSFGLERELLLLQEGDGPVPLDYRDLVRPARFPSHIETAVADFAPVISGRLQAAVPVKVAEPQTLLSRLDLGASTAENEMTELGHYYLETDEFRRAHRGEIRLACGRKGSGKTALFARLRDKLRQDRSRVVLDLRPEGFQLLKFKERVLDFLEEGTKEHTITAFWEYLLYLEICHKLLVKDHALHMRDQRLYEKYRKLTDTYYQDDFISEGDFAERMLKLTQRIADDFGQTFLTRGDDQLLRTGEITQLLYKHDIQALRKDVIEYLGTKSTLWILFDNLDKGWPPNGVTAEDALTLRCLLDAVTKIERELSKSSIECHGVIFIRNDVYELLVANTPDRGKVSRISLDWSDDAMLREMLRRRLAYGDLPDTLEFDAIWRMIFTSHIHGEESSQYLIDRSLMRPRGLIDLVRHCRSRAVNLGHTQITEADIEQGEDAYSNDLLTNIGYEIRDIMPQAENVLYELLGSPSDVRGGVLIGLLQKRLDAVLAAKALDLLLWYGIVGLLREDGSPAFIYTVKYDMQRLKGLVSKRGLDDATFRVNPAFWRALEIQHP